MPGFDTVHLWLGSEHANNVDLLSEIPLRISDTKETTDKTSNRVFISGKLKNLKVSIRNEGVSIQGSINKYLLGQNIETISREQSKLVIQNLSDELQLPLKASKVTRIDFSDNIILDYKPELYLKHFGTARYYRKFTQDKGLKYDQSKSAMVFYDKIVEARKSNSYIPPDFRDRNLLRYEMRFTRQLPKTFQKFEILASALYDPDFYNQLENLWEQKYFTITKERRFILSIPENATMKIIEDMILADWFHNRGNLENALEWVNELKARGQYSNRMQITRHRDKIRKLFQNPAYTCENELISELNEKIKRKKGG